jgi:hypothetical protein
MTERAQKIYDAWEKEYCLQKDFYEYRALANVLREIVSDYESWEDGTYMVKSKDILEIADEVEELVNRRAESRKSLDAIISLEDDNCDYFDDYGETTRE